MATKAQAIEVRPCGFLLDNCKPCGIGNTVAEYDATRGRIRVCMEHVRQIVRSWPNAPIHFLR